MLGPIRFAVYTIDTAYQAMRKKGHTVGVPVADVGESVATGAHPGRGDAVVLAEGGAEVAHGRIPTGRADLFDQHVAEQKEFLGCLHATGFDSPTGGLPSRRCKKAGEVAAAQVPVWIGNNWPNIKPFGGVIDKVAVLNGALTATEVFDHYRMGKP